MNLRILTLVVFLGIATTLPAQQRRPRPKPPAAEPSPSPTPVSSPTPDTRRKAILTMKEGDPISGLFNKADSANVQIEVAGNPITVPTEKIASIDFAEKKETKPVDESPSLAIEAAMVYNFGGAQPLARTTITLLDQSLTQILRDAGLHGGDLDIEHNRAFRQRNPSAPDFSRYCPRKPDTDATLLDDLANAIQFPTLGDGTFLGKAIEAIKTHTVISGTTDFSGKLELKDLKPSRYFVYAFTQTRGGHALWNIPVEIKPGRNSLTIDNTNAALAF